MRGAALQRRVAPRAVGFEPWPLGMQGPELQVEVSSLLCRLSLSHEESDLSIPSLSVFLGEEGEGEEEEW